MNKKLFLVALAQLAAVSACARTPEPAQPARIETARVEPAPVSAPATDAPAATLNASLPPVLVHKSPTCGCCVLWVDHLRQAGFQVEVRNSDDLNPIKEKLGVPYGKGSCHTAEVGGYFVEGHVPAEDVKRLLEQKPDARGLVLPGMPLGSPGMEVPDGTVQPYTVEIVDPQGATTAFAEH